MPDANKPNASKLRIENHRLVGDNVTWRATPNVGGALKPRYLVMHYTAGSSLKSSVESLCTVKAKGNASAHIVLGRDGSIVQLAPFNVVTWHAGVSAWNGETGLNSRSIGIEMDNAGVLTRVGDRYMTWFHKEIPAAEVMLAAHRHGGGQQHSGHDQHGQQRHGSHGRSFPISKSKAGEMEEGGKFQEHSIRRSELSANLKSPAVRRMSDFQHGINQWACAAWP